MPFPKNNIPWNKGIPMTQETKNRVSIGRRKLYNKDGSIFSKSDYDRAYRLRHPEKVKEMKRIYHIKNKDNPHYILATTLRKRLLKVLGRKSNRKSSLEFLGCSVEKLREHLQGKFKEGMTWSNHGNGGWHIDHIYPLSKVDLTDKEQLKKAFHYSNLQPLWWRENLSKFNKI
jgi:hypothetical protein